jgi:hypothetical protein
MVDHTDNELALPSLVSYYAAIDEVRDETREE